MGCTTGDFAGAIFAGAMGDGTAVAMAGATTFLPALLSATDGLLAPCVLVALLAARAVLAAADSVKCMPCKFVS